MVMHDIIYFTTEEVHTQAIRVYCWKYQKKSRNVYRNVAVYFCINTKRDTIVKILTFVCGGPFIPALLLSKINLILCKGHITLIQLFETVAHRSINRNTCTDVHAISIYHPTF